MEEPLTALFVVHWPSGPTNSCIEHAKQLANLANFLGTHVAITPYVGEEKCVQCVNGGPPEYVAQNN